jgi:hypothetical protein
VIDTATMQVGTATFGDDVTIKQVLALTASGDVTFSDAVLLEDFFSFPVPNHLLLPEGRLLVGC